jgi:hypothetical protein
MADADRLLLCSLTFGVTISVWFVCLCVWQLQILDGYGWGSASRGCQGLGLQGGRRRESHPQLHRLVPYHGMRWVGSYWVCPHRSLGFRGLYVWFAGADIRAPDPVPSRASDETWIRDAHVVAWKLSIHYFSMTVHFVFSRLCRGTFFIKQK